MSLERFAAVEAERSRLADELDEALARARMAEAAVAAGAEAKARVAALVLAAHRELLEAQARHGEAPVPGRADGTASLPAGAGPVTAVTAVAATAPAGPRAQPPPTRPAPSRRGIRRFLYVDTVLPLVAIVIVLVVLLAWVE